MSKASVGKCELCLRDHVERTVHHLIPREFGGGPEDTSKLCIPCHKQVHALYPNSELAVRLNTIEKLRDDLEIRKYLNWIKKQPAGKLPKVKKSGYKAGKR
jgi:5-methylcytosine-specific restriction protein A